MTTICFLFVQLWWVFIVDLITSRGLDLNVRLIQSVYFEGINFRKLMSIQVLLTGYQSLKFCCFNLSLLNFETTPFKTDFTI